MARLSRRDNYDELPASLPPSIRELIERVEDTRPLDMYMYFENGKQMLHVSHRDGSMEDIYLGDILDRCDGGYLINYRDDLAVRPRPRSPSPPKWLSKTTCTAPPPRLPRLPRYRSLSPLHYDSYYGPKTRYPLESTSLLLGNRRLPEDYKSIVVSKPTYSNRYDLDALDLIGLEYPRSRAITHGLSLELPRYSKRYDVVRDVSEPYPGSWDDFYLKRPSRYTPKVELLDCDCEVYGECKKHPKYLPPAVRYYDDAYLPSYNSLYQPRKYYY